MHATIELPEDLDAAVQAAAATAGHHGPVRVVVYTEGPADERDEGGGPNGGLDDVLALRGIWRAGVAATVRFRVGVLHEN